MWPFQLSWTGLIGVSAPMQDESVHSKKGGSLIAVGVIGRKDRAKMHWWIICTGAGFAILSDGTLEGLHALQGTLTTDRKHCRYAKIDGR